MTFVNKQGLPIQVKASIVMWVLGLLFSLIIGLVGVVYSSINKNIETKADKDMVESRLNNIDKNVELLLKMHLKNRGE